MRMMLIAAALMVGTVPTMAEETVIHREGPAPVAPARETTVVKERDCASKTVHREDGAGDSTTVKKTNCD